MECDGLLSRLARVECEGGIGEVRDPERQRVPAARGPARILGGDGDRPRLASPGRSPYSGRTVRSGIASYRRRVALADLDPAITAAPRRDSTPPTG